jgi:hypothetical protein
VQIGKVTAQAVDAIQVSRGEDCEEMMVRFRGSQLPEGQYIREYVVDPLLLCGPNGVKNLKPEWRKVIEAISGYRVNRVSWLRFKNSIFLPLEKIVSGIVADAGEEYRPMVENLAVINVLDALKNN